MQQPQDDPPTDEQLLSLHDHILIERALGSVQADQAQTHTTNSNAHPANIQPSQANPYQHLQQPQAPHPNSEPTYQDPNANPYETGESGDVQTDGGGGLEFVMADEADPDKNRRGAKQLRETKRAQQNRAAQRAFRARKDNHIKELEDRLASLQAQADSAKHFQQENRDLRTYVSTLQARLFESSIHCPAPPPSLSQSLPAPHRPSISGRARSIGTRLEQELSRELQGQGRPFSGHGMAPQLSKRIQQSPSLQPARPVSSATMMPQEVPMSAADLELLRHSLTPAPLAGGDIYRGPNSGPRDDANIPNRAYAGWIV